MTRRPGREPAPAPSAVPAADGQRQARDTALTIALQAAVPLWIHRVQVLTAAQRADRAQALSDVIAAHGDDILYRSPRCGATAAAFNALAEGLALAAYQPGGVTFAGHHWCTDHAACQSAQTAAHAAPQAST